MAELAVHYLLLGHLTRDLTPAGPQLGGTAAYAALTALRLDYTPGIVSACGPELDLGPVAGLPLACAPSAVSTTFENLYRPSGREQFIRARAEPLTAAMIPAGWLSAPIVHLAPLAQEIGAGLLPALSGHFIGLTPQGWLRRWDALGRVTTDVAAWPDAEAVLSQAQAAVLSIVDIDGDWAVAERWAKAAPVLVITEGEAGCTVFARGRGARQFRPPPVDEVDPTGAGDIFAAAFFIHLYETGDPWTSARFANQVAAHSVTRAGLASVPSAEEMGYCRAALALGS